MGIVINDLYTPLSKDVYRFICDDTIHLSEEGITLATDLVEDIIRREAAKINDTADAVQNATENPTLGAPV